MTTELAPTNPATILRYFEKVRELAATGEQYPINLDEVWPLVYSEKGVAVKALRKNFFENEDFGVFDQNVKNSGKGRPESEYRLTVACMEYFIARKVREVFEVYRKVFHAVANAQPAALPATPVELILQMAQAMVSNERRVSDLESRLGRMEDIQAGATVELLQLPAPTEDLPDLSTADKIRRMVNVYASAKGKPAQDIWRELYSELYYRYKVMVNGIGLLKGESKLSALVRLGHVDKLFNVALHRLRAE